MPPRRIAAKSTNQKAARNVAQSSACGAFIDRLIKRRQKIVRFAFGPT